MTPFSNNAENAVVAGTDERPVFCVAFCCLDQLTDGDPAVSERPALPPRSPDRYLKLTPVGNCRSATEINDESKESARKICGPIIYPHNNCAKADS